MRFTPNQRTPRRKLGGHYMDQFTYAERATTGAAITILPIRFSIRWSASRNPALDSDESGWTGGASATIGRYPLSKVGDYLCVVDPQNSVFLISIRRRASLTCCNGSKIKSIGRPKSSHHLFWRCGFYAANPRRRIGVATIHWLEQLIGRKTGASTGTNLYGALQLAVQMQRVENKAQSSP